MAWLIQTKQPNIWKNYLFIEDPSELWKAVKKAFFTRGNDGSMYELENQIREFHQGEVDVNTYDSTLKGLWQELDYYQSLELDGVHVPLEVTHLMEKVGLTNSFLVSVMSLIIFALW